jgi:hypothetical protein
MTLEQERRTAERLHDLMQQACEALLEGAGGDPLRAIGLLHILAEERAISAEQRSFGKRWSS